MIPKQPYSIYIASCDANGGIYRYLLDKHGKLAFIGRTDLDRPMCLTVDLGMDKSITYAIRISDDRYSV